MASPKTVEPRSGSSLAFASSDEGEAIELAQRAAAGDLNATQHLITHVWPTITRLVGSVLGASSSDVEDVVQQAFIALLRALPAFRGECHPTGYACRIAVRVAIRARRRNQLEASRLKSLERLESASAPGYIRSKLAADRRRELLRVLLADLPEEQAEALALRVVLGWSLEEVARAFGIPINTVRSRVRLAKEALRRRIEASPRLFEELALEP